MIAALITLGFTWSLVSLLAGFLIYVAIERQKNADQWY
ncbi:hypothetical protein HOR97_gp18 [Agrobacterium phage Atu_ph03]|uniref:Uncharacterized protein n=2 Tax=Atuphduovirus TaxID=2731928 RepID=A0A2L0UYX1_9CAUD|nr:hypothetical protein HOR96_gp16 [Agrobacterium phage Atu_ph02]YP_009791859.1 hypothetical protein HOR97_gp18 [Agrobacterium phage Atu_ph03]AUZ94736.1 hypothetical protein [Agrobacterium phage Atu_ph02]AUZ94777.1 hypothetical protein [Agrobacterium phage Atu_ph03]